LSTRSLSRGKELILINKGDEIEFLIDNVDDGRVWIIKPEYHTKKGIMVLEKRNGYIIRLIEKDLRKLGVRNMNELIGLIRTRPSETVENLIGEKVKISKVTVKDLSNSNAED